MIETIPLWMLERVFEMVPQTCLCIINVYLNVYYVWEKMWNLE